MKSKKWIGSLWIVAVLAAMVVVVFIFSQRPYPVNHGNTPGGGKILSAVGTELQIGDYELAVGENTTILLKAFQRFSQGGTLENVTMKITLPDNLELVSGDLSWHGDIASSGELQIQATVRAVKKGIAEIKGEAISYKSGSVEGKAAFQYTCIKSVPSEACVVSTDLKWPLCPANGCESSVVFSSGTETEVTRVG